MRVPEQFNELERALRGLGHNGRVGIRFADEFIPEDRFFVAFDCDGAPGGEVRSCAASLENAFYGAVVRLDDAGRKAA